MRGVLYRLSDRAVIGRSGRFCPSDSRFKASRVAGYTTDPKNGAPGRITRCVHAPRPKGPPLMRRCALLPAMLFEPSIFGVEIRRPVQLGHRGRLEPPGRFELPISWFEARGLIQFGYGGILVASSGFEPLTSRLSAVRST